MSRDQLFYETNSSKNSISSTADFQQDDVTMDSTKRKYPDYCRTITITDSNGQLKELVFPKALDLDRPKRARTTFSSCQLKRLEVEFQKNQYMVGVERAELASELGLSETQVKVWFQNRRTKHKKDTSVQSTVDDVISPLPDGTLSMSNASVFPGSNSSPLLCMSSLRMPSTTPTSTSQAAFDILPHSLMMTSLLHDSSSAAAAAVAMATGAGLRNLPALYTTFGAFPQIPFSS